MAELLSKRRFSGSDADLLLLANFDCGVEPWELAQSRWITGPLAIDSMSRRGTVIWLYFNSANDLVGFGSIGKTRRPHPPGSGEYANFSTIPSIAVDKNFWGEPRDGDKFSTQILDDLIVQAETHGSSILILDVHVRNLRAESFYRKYGFSDYYDEIKNDYRKMVIPLH